MSGGGKKIFPERADANGVTRIMEAARHNVLKAILECVDSKHNIDAQDNAGNTALIHAAEAKNTECGLMLIHHGADMALANKAGQTALIIACEKGLDEIVERWAVKNGPLDAQDKIDRRTALMTALLHGNSWAAVRLVDAGADYDTLRDKNGETGAGLAKKLLHGDDLHFFKLAVERREKSAADAWKASMDALVDATRGTRRRVVAPKTASFRKKSP